MSQPTSPMPNFGRRGFLLGSLGLGMAAGLAGCSPSSSPTAGSTAGGGGVVSVGSYQSDDVPKKAFAEMLAGFKGGETTINTIQHETFKQGINNYLQGSPDDVFTWFAGYRARYFASKAWWVTSPMCGPRSRAFPIP